MVSVKKIIIAITLTSIISIFEKYYKTYSNLILNIYYSVIVQKYHENKTINTSRTLVLILSCISETKVLRVIFNYQSRQEKILLGFNCNQFQKQFCWLFHCSLISCDKKSRIQQRIEIIMQKSAEVDSLFHNYLNEYLMQ